MYFFETLVRIHSAGEGAPYTGLKPGASIDPAVALADKALGSGSVDKLVDVLTNAMAKGVRERFAHAFENQKHADSSVAAGRQFVESYVVYTHYVEGLHGLIKGGAPVLPPLEPGNLDQSQTGPETKAKAETCNTETAAGLFEKRGTLLI